MAFHWPRSPMPKLPTPEIASSTSPHPHPHDQSTAVGPATAQGTSRGAEVPLLGRPLRHSRRRHHFQLPAHHYLIHTTWSSHLSSRLFLHYLEISPQSPPLHVLGETDVSLQLCCPAVSSALRRIRCIRSQPSFTAACTASWDLQRLARRPKSRALPISPRSTKASASTTTSSPLRPPAKSTSVKQD
jgi:hypothetical protein